MYILSILSQLSDLRIELLNLLFLFALSFVICTWISRKVLRITVSGLLSLFLCFELVSIYFVKTFIGYEFYVHLNLRDIVGMLDIYVVQGTVIILIWGLLWWFLFQAPRVFRIIFDKLNGVTGRTSVKMPHKNVFRWGVVLISVFVMSMQGGIIQAAGSFFASMNVEGKSFLKALEDLGMKDYVSPQDVWAEKGKNIIAISLESYERGYLSQKMRHLTPELRSLKNRWRYYEMEQNNGAKWTSGSLYASLVGLPAYFGVEGNSIFQNSFHSQISGVSHALKKAGYRVKYITSKAAYSGTQEMLYTFQFDEIVDRDIIGRPCHDKDLFEQAKKEIKASLSQNDPFAIYISTLDTHFPDGKYDARMEKYVSPQATNIEFMVSAVDYLLGDFIDYLKEQNVLDNTVVYIYPDHLKMGMTSKLREIGERGLFFLTNAEKKSFTKTGPLYQVDLPRMFIDGAGISTNVKFLTDYVSEDIEHFIDQNMHHLIALNQAGLQRYESEELKIPVVSANYDEYVKDTSRFIAHAGGMIDGYKYTNSLEALNESYQKGFRLFELDIIETSDGHFVAAHDWEHWAEITGYEGTLPPSFQKFREQKIYKKFSPLTMDGINQWFKNHQEAILVTDKINKPIEFAAAFVDKGRLMMELFDKSAVRTAVKAGIKGAIPSQVVVDNLKGNKIDKLKELGVAYVAISRNYVSPNMELIRKLKNNGIKVFVYHINFDPLIDENYVVRYELDNVYGIYADEWNFYQN
ncbi:sulfatase-like hydrolase/transferase [Marinilabilia rubra]|uniref:Sulfatase N-terminal domain-containing protein n=1 Tax=Marinilabilia rubra TaxID=2162893 RepID=A0A2U2B4N1_9BACT|nr:sulfatase-like hydrolase/transferase [Marinilabilia rubra]PWD97997.1 hypothetical protein DDZ16_18170 [Marinilabilia rubra]